MRPRDDFRPNRDDISIHRPQRSRRPQQRRAPEVKFNKKTQMNNLNLKSKRVFNKFLATVIEIVNMAPRGSLPSPPTRRCGRWSCMPAR